MQRMLPDLNPEERRAVHRWSLAVVAIYATLALAGVIGLWLTFTPSSGTLEAEVNGVHPGTSK